MNNHNIEEQEDINALQREDTAHKLPIVWVIFFLSLIVWGIYYFVVYTPEISGPDGWTQAKELQESLPNK